METELWVMKTQKPNSPLISNYKTKKKKKKLIITLIDLISQYIDIDVVDYARLNKSVGSC